MSSSFAGRVDAPGDVCFGWTMALAQGGHGRIDEQGIVAPASGTERAAALWTFGDALVGGADVPVLAERDRPAPRRADRNAWAATMEPPE